MKEKILVCGASGFVGSALVRRLTNEGYDVRAVGSRPVACWNDISLSAENIVGDLRDSQVCRDVMKDCRWVFNLAASVGGINYIQKNKADCFVSALINQNLLLEASRSDIGGYFFASSACVYGDAPYGYALREEELISPSAGYGEEKLFSEKVCRAYHDEKKVPVKIGRYHTVYGPGDNSKVGKDHAQTALCKKVIQAKLSGVPEINVWGDGSQTRSAVFIDDCVEATVRLMFSGTVGPDPVNVAHAEATSINGMVDILECAAGIELMRFYGTKAPTGVKHRKSNNDRIRKLLNWEPMTPMETGLRELFREQMERAMVQK